MDDAAGKLKFVEKKGQVNECSLVACGVEIESRHGIARELSELLAFADELAKTPCEHLVKSAYYDSNSSCCTFAFTQPIDEYGIEAAIILEAANNTISQFDWFNSIKHGAAMRDRDQDS